MWKLQWWSADEHKLMLLHSGATGLCWVPNEWSCQRRSREGPRVGLHHATSRISTSLLWKVDSSTDRQEIQNKGKENVQDSQLRGKVHLLIVRYEVCVKYRYFFSNTFYYYVTTLITFECGKSKVFTFSIFSGFTWLRTWKICWRWPNVFFFLEFVPQE